LFLFQSIPIIINRAWNFRCSCYHLTRFFKPVSTNGVVQLTPPTIFSLEQNMDFLENDELLEVTPESMRLRKRELVPHMRKRAKG